MYIFANSHVIIKLFVYNNQYILLFSPEHRFIDLVHEDSEEDPSPKLILKRQQSLSDDSGPHEVGFLLQLMFYANWNSGASLRI